MIQAKLITIKYINCKNQSKNKDQGTINIITKNHIINGIEELSSSRGLRLVAGSWELGTGRWEIGDGSWEEEANAALGLRTEI